MLRMKAQARGLRELMRRLDRPKDRIAAAAATALGKELGDLVLYIRSEKLSGQVLQRRSGKLQDSIGAEITQGATFPIRASVFSRGVPYAAIHEYGGTTAPHLIVAQAGKVLAFMIDGRLMFRRSVMHPGSVMPERSYIRSGLADRLPQIKFAVRSAIVGALTQS